MIRDHGELLPSLLSWQSWVIDYVQEWILIEQIVWSNRWMCAGRVDRIPIIKGDRYATIVDIKTGSLNDDIGIQIYGGYLPVYNEWRVKQKKGLPKATRAMAVNLPRKDSGKLVVKDYTKEKYLKEFESRAKLFRSINR